MARAGLIIGRPGSGKSTSIRTLDPKTTFIINSLGKGLPFKGWKSSYVPFNSKEKSGNIVTTCDPKHVLTVMEIVDKDMPHIITLIVEDSQFISAAEYMKRIQEKGYDKFNDIGKNLFTLMSKPKEMRDDLTVFFLNHEDQTVDENG